jgi:hypothetical protein
LRRLTAQTNRLRSERSRNDSAGNATKDIAQHDVGSGAHGARASTSRGWRYLA